MTDEEKPGSNDENDKIMSLFDDSESPRARPKSGHIPKAKYGSPRNPIRIGNIEIEAYVLDDEKKTRVLSGRGMQKAMGLPMTSGKQLGILIRRSNLRPYISAELREKLENPITFDVSEFYKGSVQFAVGLEATLLPELCDAILEARKDKALNDDQKAIAHQCEVLTRAFAKIGIIALVDEATGFQKERDKEALQSLLDIYVAKEFQPHFKTFVDAFYEEIYRLKHWDYNPKKNKYQVVGKYTLQYVYGCLPTAVVDAVKKKTPRGKSGNYTKKLFQSLTAEVGKPHLDRALGGVIALMKASSTWEGFKRSFARAYGDQQNQLQLPMELLEEES